MARLELAFLWVLHSSNCERKMECCQTVLPASTIVFGAVGIAAFQAKDNSSSRPKRTELDARLTLPL
jgi:hypothetical protein